MTSSKPNIDDRLNLTLQTALTLDAVADKLIEGIDELKAALRVHEKLLKETSIKLMEKEIHGALKEYDERKQPVSKRAMGGFNVR